jgi:hypothetical protein
MSFPDIDYALYQKIAGGTAITALVGGTASPRIYNLQAPQSATLPYIVFYHNAGGFDNETLRGEYTFNYRVEAVGSNRQSCYNVVNACINHLHNNDVPITGYDNFQTIVEQVNSFIDNSDGVEYWRKVFDIRIRYTKG